MRKITIICDKCKREVDKSTLFTITGHKDVDICPGCKEVFDSWIAARLAEWCDGTPLAEPIKEESPAKVIYKPNRGGRKIEIDYDKACALRKAGWSYDNIADELNCGPSTIYRKLHQEGYYEAYLNGVRMGGNSDEGND